MPSLSAVRAANAAFTLAYRPVVVLVGGTSGIGRALAETFVRYTNGNAYLIVCGRNRAAADSILASFPKPHTHEFVQCDVALMKNVADTTSELLARLPRVNFLVASPGFFSLRGRDETAEGIDRRLALHYYARWKFTHDLLPLMRKAKDAGQDAKMMSVLGAGTGGKIDVNDLQLKNGYNFVTEGLAAATYNDLMIESFAERQPDMSFTHIFPGIVRTPMISRSHRALRPLSGLLSAAMYPFSASPADCAEYLFWALTHAQAGATRRNNKGEDIGKTKYFGSEEVRTRLWDHTVIEIARATK